MTQVLPERFNKLLQKDQNLDALWQSRNGNQEDDEKILSHLHTTNRVFTHSDLRAILGPEAHLEQILAKTLYKPLEYSTGEDLDQAIESTSFIAEGWLPRGHVTALVSSPGLGKSYLALGVVKIITTSQEKWFDEKISVKVNSKVVIWCEAEGFQAGLKDRIKQLGIPPESIILPFNDPLVDFKLEQHLENLKRAIAYHKPDLVVIDSLRGSHGREENDSKAMQSVMSRLVSLAKEFDVAVLVTHHTNKPAPGQPDLVDLHRVRGSTAITANCRMIWGMERPDPRDETVRLKVVKSNLAPFPDPHGLIITDEGIEWTEAPATLEERNLERVRETKEDTAAGWLRDFLKAGPKPSKEVQSEGEEAGHRWATLRRAAKRPGLITKLAPDKKHNFWRWALDAHSPPSNRDEQVNNYEQVEHV
ncbi:MAG: AAA family ATPase [Acidobacteria bacterium]|nr:AAA family ATPase [Acidobacteriota bacterium]